MGSLHWPYPKQRVLRSGEHDTVTFLPLEREGGREGGREGRGGREGGKQEGRERDCMLRFTGTCTCITSAQHTYTEGTYTCVSTCTCSRGLYLGETQTIHYSFHQAQTHPLHQCVPGTRRINWRRRRWRRRRRRRRRRIRRLGKHGHVQSSPLVWWWWPFPQTEGT